MFNALVLFCIRDIHGALQKILSLKQDKGQKKYEVEIIAADLTYLLLMSRNVAVERWFLTLFSVLLRMVLPSSSPKWQKNQIDIKMYLSGVVQVCSGFLTLIFPLCIIVR